MKVTIGVEFYSKIVELASEDVALQIWDTVKIPYKAEWQREPQVDRQVFLPLRQLRHAGV